MTGQADSRQSARVVFWFALAVIGIEGLAYAIVLPHLPLVVGSRAPWWSVGLLLGSYSIAQFFMLNPIARAAQRYGVRPVIVGCLTGTALGLVLMAVSTNYWVLLASRIIDGASAGTVAVVTAVALSWFDSGEWVQRLGKLNAIRGGTVLAGILTTAGLGLALDDSVRALQTAAWVGVGLTVAAVVAVSGLRLGGLRRDSRGADTVPLEPSRALTSHVAAQAGQAGVLVVAPALGYVSAGMTASLIAPASAIVGLAVGQVVLARRIHASRLAVALTAICLIGGALAVPFESTVLVGLAMLGMGIGAAVPNAQSRLLRRLMRHGCSDLEANATSARAAVIGQIAGPIAGYLALALRALAASSFVAGLGLSGLPWRSGSYPRAPRAR